MDMSKIEHTDIIGYTLTPIVQPKGYIYTQAFIFCYRCQGTISAMGGPNYNAICMKCLEEINKDESN